MSHKVWVRTESRRNRDEEKSQFHGSESFQRLSFIHSLKHQSCPKSRKPLHKAQGRTEANDKEENSGYITALP